jgi:hypothetical protein
MTTPNPGACGAIWRVTLLSPTRFNRATIFGIGTVFLPSSLAPPDPGTVILVRQSRPTHYLHDIYCADRTDDGARDGKCAKVSESTTD